MAGVVGPVGMMPSMGGGGMDPFTAAMGIGMIGQGIFGGLLGNSQAKKNEKLERDRMAMQGNQFAAQMAGQTAGLNPAAQRQKMALMHALLGNMTAPPGVEAPAGIPMGKLTGGFQIPEGGFGDLLRFTSPEAMSAQEGFFQQALARAAPGTPRVRGYQPQQSPYRSTAVQMALRPGARRPGMDEDPVMRSRGGMV